MAEQTAGKARLEPHVRDFLNAPGRFAVLATINPDGTPLQAVVWFLVEDETLLVNSKEGRRWPTNLRRDPRCSFTVEDGWEYVAVRGTVEVLDDPEQAQSDIAAMARRYRDPEHAEEMIEQRFRPQRRVSFRLSPSSVTVHGDLE